MDVQYVFKGKDFASKERAEARIKSLVSKGYKLESDKGRKLTYKLN